MPTFEPIFAAFEFNSKEQARAAWRAVNDNPTSRRDLSCWSTMTPDRRRFIVVVLGERQERVDGVAEIVMRAPGCLGNYILPEVVKVALCGRRYGLALEAATQGLDHVSRENHWDDGVTLDKMGRPL